MVKSQNWILDYLLPPDYNRDVMPINNADQKSLQVNVTLYINLFRGTDNELHIDADLYLCLKWYDYRLLTLPEEIIPPPINTSEPRKTYGKIQITDYERLWIPKVYFRNGVQSNVINSLRDLQYVSIYPEKHRLKYCQRSSTLFMCHFITSNLPFDEQNCYFEIESLDIWNDNVTLNITKFRMPDGNEQFRVREQVTDYCQPKIQDPFNPNLGYNLTQNSCVFARVQLVRHVGYYIMRYYTPTALLVLMNFVQFWTPTVCAPGRAIFTGVIEMTMKSVSITAYGETSSRHVTSLFWWQWGCQFFIFVSEIEYAMIFGWAHFVVDKHHARKNNYTSPDGYYFGKNNWYKKCGAAITKCLHFIFGPIDFFADPVNRNKVDYFARVLFPATFFFYICLYVVASFPPWAWKYRMH
ncbi:glycine receptor subunit alpha-2-like [Dermatophagoides pteronyssinus]|uniref:glycine receptor subunit alpha-2-like n=1 Tax=Dermatophagoides pteronyssinus TaxID=6956 RepID=UPI003F68007F